jgi:sulfate adenylyltransferase subunit 1 (EFTu-like GTPase family)
MYGEDDLAKAEAGYCVGVVFDCEGLKRGQVGARPGELPPLSLSLRASVFWLSPQPLSADQELTVRCSTQDTRCQVAAIDRVIDSSTLEQVQDGSQRGELRATEVGEVRIRTCSPMVVEAFQRVPELGRFVLQRDGEVVAGGIVSAAG